LHLNIPGIGPKLASKIIFELKDKVSNEEMLSKTVIKNNPAIDEAVTALKVLGYSERELTECINEINTDNKSVQDIIRMCLNYMRK
jgi:Holliday junction DNA helicase RuvA